MNMRIQRSRGYRLATLELTGNHIDVQLTVLSNAGRREGRVLVRSFLRQVRPWLEQVRDTGVPKLRASLDVQTDVQTDERTNVPTLGFDIKMQRLKMGLSQTQCAELIGVGRTHLSDIERGKYRPGPKTCAQLRDLLGIATPQGNRRGVIRGENPEAP